MIKQLLLKDLNQTVKGLGFKTSDIDLYIPEKEEFGDYTTNIALQLAKQNSQKTYHSSLDIANAFIEKLGHPVYLERIDIAGPGFINFFIKDSALVDVLKEKTVGNVSALKSRKILVEYGHTNPLKEVHIGHLRTFILGESICRILRFTGNQVFRANYQGDIGLHIAKAIWGIKKVGLPKKDLTLEEKAQFMGESYAQGNKAYESDVQAKEEIDQINISLYKKDPELQELYQLAREWSLDYFEPIYQTLGIKYDRCFFESEVYEEGKQIILDQIGKVFEENEGAVIFPGEKFGLHTRVFITSAGNPTYEGKEIGLAKLEYDTFNYDHSIHVVASEQAGYFEVVFKAIELIFPHFKDKKQHLSYGLVDLKEGKMSSRTGNIISFDRLLELVIDKVLEIMSKESKALTAEEIKKIALAAIKFSYLSYAPNTNMVFDLEGSVSLQGDSGPYVLYCYVRTQSLLGNFKGQIKQEFKKTQLTPEEREVLRLLEQFSYIVENTSQTLTVNNLSSYLIRLARSFNHFYEYHPVLKSEHEAFRVALTQKTGEVLKTGLNLLGIEAPERM